METLTPAERVLVIAIGLILTAAVALVVLPWLSRQITERLPHTPTPLPTAAPTRAQLTRTPTPRLTMTPTSVEPTTTPTPLLTTTVTGEPSAGTPAATPTPFRTQGLELDGRHGQT